MSMQPHHPNPIEARKQQTRRNARSALICVAGGVGGGVVLSLLAGSVALLVLGLIVAVAGGAYYGNKVRTAIAKDPNSPY